MLLRTLPGSRRWILTNAFTGAFAAMTACSGLSAGPEATAKLPVPASRDSVYVRARRAVQAESFTMDVVDSNGGRLVGTRYPSANAKLGSGAACRVTLALGIQGNPQQADVSTTSRWVAPSKMLDKAPQICEQERADVLQRIAQTVAPAAP